MYACVYACMHACVYACMCICIYVCMHARLYIYICTHMHTCRHRCTSLARAAVHVFGRRVKRCRTLMHLGKLPSAATQTCTGAENDGRHRAVSEVPHSRGRLEADDGSRWEGAGPAYSSGKGGSETMPSVGKRPHGSSRKV